MTLLGAAVSTRTSSSGGAFTLNFYNFPDNSGAIQPTAYPCTKASAGRRRELRGWPDQGVDRRKQDRGRRRHAQDSAPDRDVAGQTRRRPAEHRRPAALVPRRSAGQMISDPSSSPSKASRTTSKSRRAVRRPLRPTHRCPTHMRSSRGASRTRAP
jgi:hypothetical protein